MEGLVYVLLVEAGHIGVHLFVVVPYVPLCAAIGYSTEAEWRREVIRILKLDKIEKAREKYIYITQQCPQLSMNTQGTKCKERCHLKKKLKIQQIYFYIHNRPISSVNTQTQRHSKLH